MAGKDVLAILLTGFGKSLIYQVYCHAQTSTESVLVISPLNSIVEEHVNEMTELGIPAVHLNPNSQECLQDISEGKFRIIFGSAEACLAETFKQSLKSQAGTQISMIVVDECQMVETW